MEVKIFLIGNLIQVRNEKNLADNEGVMILKRRKEQMSVKRRTALSWILACVIVVAGLVAYPQNAFAKSNDTQIKNLVKTMDTYECRVLGEEKKIVKLTKAEMAKAAALTLKVSDKDGVDVSEFGGYVTYKITNKSLKKASQNLFGIALSTKNLEKKAESDGIFDAYRKTDGTPVVYIFDGETECDYVVHDIKIQKESSSRYQVEKSVYYGYWGSNNGQPNYKIVYQVSKSAKSKYGFKIKTMKVIPL